MWAATILVDSAWIAIAASLFVGMLAWTFRIERLITRMEATHEALLGSIDTAIGTITKRLDRHSDQSDGHEARIRKCEESLASLVEATRVIAGIRRMGDEELNGSGIRKRKAGGQ